MCSYQVYMFGTDRELQNTVEIGKFPPEKVYLHLNLPTFRGGGGVQLTDISPAIRCLCMYCMAKN